MHILNDDLIIKYIRQSKSILNIWNFSISNLQHTFYYFRLGSKGFLNGNPFLLTTEKENSFLELKPGDYAIINSLEIFDLSANILAIFGQASDLTRRGAQLAHSPFVDPLFIGQLELGLFNHSKETIHLEFKTQIIGKISFFDISDTHPITVKAGSRIEQKYKERRPEIDDESLHGQFDDE